MTLARASLVCALVAALANAGALGNRFALDDGPIVERNPVAHDVGAAAHAFLSPYWPPEHQAGQWRPLVILSFAAGWSVSGGSPAWLHAENVLWHAAVTALLVPVLAAFVPLTAALAGGLVFAVHPVHVEAVANLVGRAELMTAFFLLAAILAARGVRRRRAAARPTLGAEALLLVAVAAALLSKEHAAVAVALLALDELATPGEPAAGLPRRDYAAVLVLTVVWLLVRRHVEGGLSFRAVAPTFFGLGASARISTMLPVVFVLLRLLVWPFDLSPDYHPRVVERLDHPTPEGVAGALVLIALVGLTLITWRRHRTVSAGLWFIGIAWLPTANLLFPTGIVIAERTLYLATVGVALLAAAGADLIARHKGPRFAVIAAALVALPLAARTVTAVPAWKDNRSLVLSALLHHPESYRVHATAARVYRRLGAPAAALREYRIADELYPLDYYLLAEIGALALDEQDPRLALSYLRRAEALDTNNTLTQQLLAHALLEAGRPAEALAHARLSVVTGPTRAAAARVLAASFVALGERDSALAVWAAFGRRGGKRFERWLYLASTYAALGIPDSAQAAFDSAMVGAPTDSTSREQIKEARGIVRGAVREASVLR